ncbi:hypothetical protein [Nocardioides caricicola]|uniref:Uncharacterized protein n=1 Tax=Nocardioides caricicola TaxID=634770 RepID=A0ABW0MWJ4_9ACTN
MRDVLHIIISLVVVAVAAVCVLAQLSDADQALDRFDGDRAVVQQVSR